MTDNEIIEHIKNNRNNEILVILYKNLPMIRKMILTNGGKIEDVEDVFQEALLVLCMNIKKDDFKLTSKLSTYLFSISQFMWKAELRKRNRMNFKYVEIFPDNADHESISEELIKKEEENQKAETVYNALETRCKELLSLYYTKKMKMKEIALQMGFSSEDSAKTQKYKCLETARKNFESSQVSHSTVNT